MDAKISRVVAGVDAARAVNALFAAANYAAATEWPGEDHVARPDGLAGQLLDLGLDSQAYYDAANLTATTRWA